MSPIIIYKMTFTTKITWIKCFNFVILSYSAFNWPLLLMLLPFSSILYESINCIFINQSLIIFYLISNNVCGKIIVNSCNNISAFNAWYISILTVFHLTLGILTVANTEVVAKPIMLVIVVSVSLILEY